MLCSCTSSMNSIVPSLSSSAEKKRRAESHAASLFKASSRLLCLDDVATIAEDKAFRPGEITFEPQEGLQIASQRVKIRDFPDSHCQNEDEIP
jgi:hypothetical protein